MYFPLKPLCEDRFIRKDGTSLIYIQYCYSAKKRILLNTKIAIPPKLWNPKKLSVIDNLELAPKNARELNYELRRMIIMVEDIIRYVDEHKIKNPEEFIKKIFKPSFDIRELERSNNVIDNSCNKTNQDIYFQIDDLGN